MYQAIIEASPVACFLLVDGKITLINQAFTNMFGYVLSDIPTVEDWRKAAYPDQSVRSQIAAEGDAVFASSGKNAPTIAQMPRVIRSKDGASKNVLVYANRVEGLDSTFLVSYVDVSQREQLTLELAKKNAELEKADRAKSDFLAMMSHELRTPMAGLLGMADLLLLSGLNTEQIGLTQRLQRSARVLLDILNDILDLSKLNADKMIIEKRPFILSELMEDLRELFAPIARERKLDFNVTLIDVVQDAVLGDAKRIRQVVTNLLSNAFKFTEHGRIALVVEQTQSEAHTFVLRITVSDTGIGIPQNKVAILFQPFSQADTSTSRIYGGTGLGLSICRKLSNAMGGEIAVSSCEGQGSSFAFTVKLQADRTAVARKGGLDRRASDGAKQTPTLARGLNKLPPLRVLVAEDNDTTRFLVTAMLEKFGHKVTAVENGLLALDAAKREKFDVALIDMQMPVMDGPEAIQSIRAHERSDGSRLPVIALTADVLAENQQKYLTAGADVVAGKPIDWAALADLIFDLLKINQRQL